MKPLPSTTHEPCRVVLVMTDVTHLGAELRLFLWRQIQPGEMRYVFYINFGACHAGRVEIGDGKSMPFASQAR